MDGDEYGIPIYLKPYENVGTAQPERETQTTVYRRIITDCEEALALLEKTPKKSWNLAYDKNFIHSLLAEYILSRLYRQPGKMEIGKK